MNTINRWKYSILSMLLVASMSACDSTGDLSAVSADQSVSPAATKSNQGTPIPVEGGETRITAPLIATAADPLASGTARWEIRPDRVTFTCEVEDVTTSGSHEVRVNGVTIGSVNVVAGLGDLNLDSRNGDSIPSMNTGDRIQVFNPTGRVILRGRFALVD
jgi:hypothetical protein